MKVYKQLVRSKRELLMELGKASWRTRQELTELLTIIAKRTTYIRFCNIIHTVIVSDMSPEEVIHYLTFLELPLKEVV